MEDSKRSGIIEAARKRFAHFGLAKTTMQEIASDIGMSKASLYYYFTDKEQVFIAVLERDFAEFTAVIESLIERPSKPSFKLKKYVSLRSELLLRLLNLAKIGSVTPSEVFNPLFDSLRIKFFEKECELVGRILQYGVDQGEFRKISVESHANLFISTLVGLRIAAFTLFKDHPLRSERADEQTDAFVAIFLQSL